MATRMNGYRFKIDSIIFLAVTIVVVSIFLSNPQVGAKIEEFGQLGGPIVPYISGFFYSISVTAPAATAAIFYLGKIANPFYIALAGAFGAATTDFILFNFLRKRASQSVEYLASRFKTKYKATRKTIRIFAMVVAGLIIASPLPDELGVAILAAINIKPQRFVFFSFVLNFLGILAIAWLGSVL